MGFLDYHCLSSAEINDLIDVEVLTSISLTSLDELLIERIARWKNWDIDFICNLLLLSQIIERKIADTPTSNSFEILNSFYALSHDYGYIMTFDGISAEFIEFMLRNYSREAFESVEEVLLEISKSFFSTYR
ncbi:hypothetical protein G4Y79_04575 [Phototrophicus methaneseepsis]|uniref:Uncharacterized protein n=1 Tax=Phototrophicus methaneseepsis TaxID=2710758 RepID=A0A7S8EB03_9CHLR|nr:hypothetical protein [Phototrophicus methaneseepsis]QPC83662.1 hypothetical protein G4Y79_04575 [Phototrophicus methaneseepsis]